MESKWTKEEFESKFLDIRKHKPLKGQVLAQYRAVAHFVDDWVKRNVIKMLKDNSTGAETAQRVMLNMVCAIEEDSIRVPLEMAKDLAAGMSEDDVANKEYKLIVEYNYWTNKENIPDDDPHWFTIDILNNKEPVENTIESIFETSCAGFAPSPTEPFEKPKRYPHQH